mgnify:FL=1
MITLVVCHTLIHGGMQTASRRRDPLKVDGQWTKWGRIKHMALMREVRKAETKRKPMISNEEVKYFFFFPKISYFPIS